MSLNLVNKTSALVSGLKRLGVKANLPLFGIINSLNSESFKYSPTGLVSDTLIIKKIDLSLLFSDLTLDITGLVNPTNELKDLPKEEVLTDETLTSEPMLNNVFLISDTNRLEEELFIIWTKWLGVQNLPFEEVTVTLHDSFMVINANRSKIYTGEITVRYKEDVVEDTLEEEPLINKEDTVNGGMDDV